MGRLLDIAQRTQVKADENAYRVNDVNRVALNSEKTPLAERPRKPYAIDAVSVEGKTLAAMNADLSLLHDRIIKARCQQPKKGTHAEAVTWLQGQVDKLAALSVSIGGTEDGWPDPSDPYADNDQLTMLREDLADLTREDALYPLGPLTEFPFEMQPPRYYNGRVIEGDTR